MQGLVAASWRLSGPPQTHHVGDLAWRRARLVDGAAEQPMRLWEEDGHVIAWAALTPPDELEVFLGPDHRTSDLLADAIAWGQDLSGASVKVDSLSSDAEWQRLLTGLGYAPDEEDPLWYHVRALELAPQPSVVPAGYELRNVRLPDDLSRRVEVHRAAFGRPGRPSRLTDDGYARVAATWPYREELDWVVETPDGSFAASCLTWLDERNATGLLEPVGAHPDHRRRGLASAACLGALRALHGAGARTAIVCAQTDEARALYRSLGFVERARYVWYRNA